MAKLTGNLQITVTAATAGTRGYFELAFIPYAGRLDTRTIKVKTHDELISLLMDLKIGEDEAAKWAGRARSQGVVLIPSVERADSLLREMGLQA
jgi:hypothetical protein